MEALPARGEEMWRSSEARKKKWRTFFIKLTFIGR
jgi:hypothetical protein